METYTREQFDKMTTTDIVCPYPGCEALVGQPCVIRGTKLPRDAPHMSRVKWLIRIKHSATVFFDALANWPKA